MAPTTVASLKIPKALRRWNSILSPDHRRSQSLTSMHKSHPIEGHRSTTSLGTFILQDDEQSGTLITPSDVEVPGGESDQQHQTSRSPSRSTTSRQSSNDAPPPAPPIRPKPAPRLWDIDVVSESSPGIAPTHIFSPSLTLQTAPESSESPKSIISKFSTWKEKSFAGRRKGSIPDLELGPDKNNVKPFNPDSPSLPPIYSARTESTIMTLGSTTPRPWSKELGIAPRTPEWQERDQRRASSMLLPSSLAPIVVSSVPARTPPLPPINTIITKKSRTEDRPPRPPPKSPRTLLRAFPVPRSATLPGRHTPNSSINSISPIETPSTAGTTWSPVSMFSTTSNQFPDLLLKSPSKSNNTSCLNRDRKISDPQPDHRIPRKTSLPALGDRSKIMPESSPVLNRGRPTKRVESLAIQKGYGQCLPKKQICQVSLDELIALRSYAEDRVSNHDILTQTQITELNQELKALDEDCISIQQTISELKESRQATYLSMKSYLESSTVGSTTFIRDHCMEQTKALYDLDTQLDDQQNKLDVSGDRRLIIQSKVWEHLTAILTTTNLVEEIRRPREYTPPRSPERIMIGRRLSEASIQEDLSKGSPRNDIESITIFADSGVANLLRSIEEELDVIDQSRHQYDEGWDHGLERNVRFV